MIDIHSHILFGVDDGADSLSEALKLILAAQKEGVEKLFATPHYYGERPTHRELLQERAACIREALREQGSSFPIYLGNEVLWFESMPKHLKEGRILPLGNSRFVLTEFFPGEKVPGILYAIRRIREAGYRAVIAHCERIQDFYKAGLEEVIGQGALLQISTAVFEAPPWSRELAFCKRAVKNNWIHFLGTDAHNMAVRPPKARAAIQWIQKHAPDPEALLKGNAQRYLLDACEKL